MAADEGARRRRAGWLDPYLPLPKDLDNPRVLAGNVFDEVADLYDSARPGYPAAAIAELVARCRLDPGRSVLEIGCGTGQLTKALAPLGCRITCVEPGAALAERARANLVAFSNVAVRQTSFEDAKERPGSHDLVVAATAFHWIDPSVGFAKAFQLLRPGGFLALMTNSHGAGGTDETIAAEVAALHHRFAPELGTWTLPSPSQIEASAEGGGDIAAVWERIERKFERAPSVSALFEEPLVRVFPWLATYDTRGYLDVLGSQSAYALMGLAVRAELFDALGALIDVRLRGTVTKQYVTVLAISKRRGGHATRAPNTGR